MDNLQSHKTPAVLEWLQQENGEVEFIFTPKHASWLNQIELWFKELNQKCVKRASTKSLEEIEKLVMDLIDTYNKYFAHPYDWKYDGILKKHEKLAAWFIMDLDTSIFLSMGGEAGWFSKLLGFLDEAIGQFPDKRTGKNTRYSMRDVALLSVLGILYPKPLLSLPSAINAATQRQQ